MGDARKAEKYDYPEQVDCSVRSQTMTLPPIYPYPQQMHGEPMPMHPELYHQGMQNFGANQQAKGQYFEQQQFQSPAHVDPVKGAPQRRSVRKKKRTKAKGWP